MKIKYKYIFIYNYVYIHIYLVTLYNACLWFTVKFHCMNEVQVNTDLYLNVSTVEENETVGNKRGTNGYFRETEK